MPIQMSKPVPQHHYEVIDIEKFCGEGIFREKSFRDQIKEFNWNQFSEKEVLVKGCGNIPVPTWAYMLVATRASSKAKKVFYGEVAKPILVFPQELS